MADEKMLNGLRVDKINAILDSMRDDPEVLKGVTGPWKSRVVWQGGFQAPRPTCASTSSQWTSPRDSTPPTRPRARTSNCSPRWAAA